MPRVDMIAPAGGQPEVITRRLQDVHQSQGVHEEPGEDEDRHAGGDRPRHDEPARIRLPTPDNKEGRDQGNQRQRRRFLGCQHQPGSDPGAVVFDALQAAKNRKFDTLVIDTAGRLHTKYNLNTYKIESLLFALETYLLLDAKLEYFL